MQRMSEAVGVTAAGAGAFWAKAGEAAQASTAANRVLDRVLMHIL
jgi:hypothetical protein